MSSAEGARTFQTTGAAYDSFMGRYSKPLAVVFADSVGLIPGQTALDVGCGPGALTGVLVQRLGVDAVWACDPSPSFVAECAARHPGLDVRQGRAEELPFPADHFDAAMAQLVLHFVSDPRAASTEMRRVVRGGGLVAACVWDFADGMQMLRAFWDAAVLTNPSAPDEAAAMRFGRPGEIKELFESIGLLEVTETTLEVSSSYESFDELWTGFLAGVGPAGAYCLSLDDNERMELSQQLLKVLDEPSGRFELSATARSAKGRVPF
jgi:ubiquinone/menaquinone biosynthesis C-methylase UbiE